MTLGIVILTKNEELHIRRALSSAKQLASYVMVVDSGSTDRTVEISDELGAVVKYHSWTTHAAQFNWALAQLPQNITWVLRLDADEFLTDELAKSIQTALNTADDFDFNAFTVSRSIVFLGRRLRHGGVFPARIVRLFRRGFGQCENRWMDEHIEVSGNVGHLSGDLIDHNLNTLTWWISKHNDYASREVMAVLIYQTNRPEQVSSKHLLHRSARLKRILKTKAYAYFPTGVRAFLYFFYRYFIRFGFLDGKEGLFFHFLQAFWYRFLIDAKLYEVRRGMEVDDLSVREAAKKFLGYELPPTSAHSD